MDNLKFTYQSFRDIASNNVSVVCSVVIGDYKYAQIANDERLDYQSDFFHLKKLVYKSRKNLEKYLDKIFDV